MNLIYLDKNHDHPDLIFYDNLYYTPKLHLQNNVFITEGITTFKKLLQSKIEIKSILITPKYLKIIEENKHRFENTNILIFRERKQIDEIIGFKCNEPIYAIAKIPDFISLESIGSKAILLNGVSKGENVGAICRNALAMGFDTLIFDEKTCNPYLRRVVRVSLGSVFFMNFAKSNNAIETIQNLRENTYQIVAIEQHSNSIDIKNISRSEKICFIFGNESTGIEKSILDLADVIAEIKVNQQVGSLNVAACSAIVFWWWNNLKET